MIIRVRENDIVLIEQDIHGRFAGEIAKHIQARHFPGGLLREETILAAYEHDRCWTGLDHTPIWNDRERAPFSFMNYPVLPKLAFYRTGIDEIEAMNGYAGLLCSMHFTSFFIHNTPRDCIAFVHGEQERQRRLKEQYRETNEDLLTRHLNMLQFCDDLSLYVCLNEPGCSKEEEHPWYRAGIPHSEVFDPGSAARATAVWLNDGKVQVRPFPFEHEFTATLRCRVVSKEDISANGLDQAYRNVEPQLQHVTFCE